jgi:putative peptidoglycan lipid II flippase
MISGALRLFTGSLAGKILGVLREILLAAAFGVTGPAAAFRTAQTAVLAPVNLVSADTLSAGFVPVHARYLVADARKAAIYYRSIRNLLVVASAVLAVVVLALRSPIARLVAPGFDSDLSMLTAQMIAVMALGVPAYMYTALASYLEMSNGIYRIASVRASVQSIGLMLGIGLAVVYDAPVWLAAGFSLAYFVLAAWAAVRMSKLRLSGDPGKIARADRVDAYKTLWRLVKPLLPLPFLLQGAILVERALSTLVSTSAAAALDYARVFSDTTVLLVATPLGLASLSAYANLSSVEVRSRAGRLLLPLLYLGALAGTVMAFYGTEISNIVFGRGAFDADAARITGTYLIGFGAGIAFQLVAYFLVKVLNSQHRSRDVFLTIGSGAVAMMAVDLALFRELGVLGIGIGASAGALVQMLMATRALGLRESLTRRAIVLAPPVGLSIVVGVYSAIAHANLAIELAAHLAVWAIATAMTPELRKIFRSLSRFRGTEVRDEEG